MKNRTGFLRRHRKFRGAGLKGRQFHCIQLHIEVLKQQRTLFKNHNKAGSGGASRDAVHGLHARFALMHIEVLNQHTTLLKNLNKTELRRNHKNGKRY
ncbi:hypothetical protein PROCOU_15694 [Listeria rocourtiae FSL F6-920]|nr:hypothetical protein PROCOU_15694 [Listeria rocourtiae FSL F6-920]